MSLIGNDLYRFDDFELQPSRRALLRRGEKIAIAPKTFEVLLCLVQNAGRVVLKEELLSAVWPGAFVEESNLTQHIFWLRKALRDKAAYIVTIPGRGYEFVGEVTAVSEQENSEAAIANAHVGFRVRQSTEVTHIVVEERSVVREPRPLALPGRRRRTAVIATAATVIVALASWGAWRWHNRAVPGDHHEVVLAEFGNTTGDPAFDQALRTLLAIDLNESHYLVVTADNDTRTVLKLMNRPPDSPLTPALALDVCQRMNDQVVLSGAIANFGRRYLVTLTATDCQTGKDLVQSKSTSENREGVIHAVDTVAADMRRRLGESLKTRKGEGPRLPTTITSSLDALRAYSQAQQTCSMGKREDGVALYKHALELDSKFTAAYLDLGYCYQALREYALGATAITKAYELRDQGDDSLRLRIEAGYEDMVTGDMRAELRVDTEWTELYPNQAQAWLELAGIEGGLARPDLATEHARRALALAPDNGRAYGALAGALNDAGRAEEAKAICREAIRRKIDGRRIHALLFNEAFAEHNTAVMDEQAAWLVNVDKVGEIWEYPLFTEGKAHTAVATWLNHIDSFRRDGLNEKADRKLRVLMHREADYAMTNELKQQLATADPHKLPLNLVYANVAMGRIPAAKAALKAYAATVGSNTTFKEIYLPQARAAIDLALHKPEQAIADLEISRWSDGFDPEGELARGTAYLAAHNAIAAEREFRSIIDHPYISSESPSKPLAHLGLARALEMQGKHSASRREYEALFAIWKSADADLVPLVQARNEYARLP
jgi:DNA-binding winged helix-turn-helix (wHTH) protein/tetratricopeptide (TPR) repeat protein